MICNVKVMVCVYTALFQSEKCWQATGKPFGCVSIKHFSLADKVLVLSKSFINKTLCIGFLSMTTILEIDRH